MLYAAIVLQEISSGFFFTAIFLYLIGPIMLPGIFGFAYGQSLPSVRGWQCGLMGIVIGFIAVGVNVAGIIFMRILITRVLNTDPGFSLFVIVPIITMVIAAAVTLFLCKSLESR